jgi:hypothetical protein
MQIGKLFELRDGVAAARAAGAGAGATTGSG